MKTFEVEVTRIVKVTVDETKFTPEFLKKFASYMYDFDCIEDHAEHIAELAAREMLDTDFIEGYGDPNDFGIDAIVMTSYSEIQGI